MKIIWTRKAKISFVKIMDWLNEHWTQTEINNFANETRKTIFGIKDNPLMYLLSAKKKTIRKAFVNKKVSLFYKVNKQKKEIILLLFWDNRQNPQNLDY